MSPAELTALRTHWLSLGNELQGSEFADERGRLDDMERRALPRRRAETAAAFEEYAQALAAARRDRPAFEAWVDAFADPTDNAGVRRRKRDMKHDIWWDWSLRKHAGWTPAVTCRPEAPADHARVRDVLEAAFERGVEADITDELRGNEGVFVVVAERGADLVGVSVVSPVRQSDDFAVPVGLAPVAVHPDHQGRSVGSAVVQGGLDAAWDACNNLCFVLGSPDYYNAWFTTAAPRWRCKWPGTEAAFQVAFSNWAVSDHWEAGGLVEYDPAFDRSA